MYRSTIPALFIVSVINLAIPESAISLSCSFVSSIFV
jgi:hypothetical protein